ncbi:MAG: hypothetical protein KBT41_04430, partial [bacterium]|nr:hypothetical protein [Candidatus Colousia faecequi]
MLENKDKFYKFTVKDNKKTSKLFGVLKFLFDKLRCTSANEQALCFRFAVILASCCLSVGHIARYAPSFRT